MLLFFDAYSLTSGILSYPSRAISSVVGDVSPVSFSIPGLVPLSMEASAAITKSLPAGLASSNERCVIFQISAVSLKSEPDLNKIFIGNPSVISMVN